MATLVTRDEGSQDVREPVESETDAVTEARRVVEPDLLWIESVTDRLLGTAGRPAAWERVYFEGREDADLPGVDQPAAQVPAALEPQAPPAEPPAADLPGSVGEPLPQRTPRTFDGPVSYRQPAGYVPSPTVDPLEQTEAVDPLEQVEAAVDPAPPAEDHGVSEADPHRQEPTLSAEPSPVDLAPTTPHLQQVPPTEPEPARAEPGRGEEMPPAVLRAALRNALPDVLGVPASSGPADAVFGDPRWNLPAEEDEDVAPAAAPAAEAAPSEPAPEPPAATEPVAPPERAEQVAVSQPRAQQVAVSPGRAEEAADLTADDGDRLRAAAAEEQSGAEATGDQPAFADEPVQEPYFEPAGPRTPPPYAHLGYGFPRASDQLTVADVALRLAFRSQDRELAEAVVRLVAGQERERARLRTAEAYLDAILDEGDAALPGAARLRRILGD